MNFTESNHALDGNAAAGMLSEVFALEMTAAVLTCGGCGSARPLAESNAFMGGPGLILRCATCKAILARLVRSPKSYWFDFSGTASIRVPTALA